jgi:cellulose synthase/poly-beta-1,6-N-acetylglucosamine synthase-like glycosyltransferase
MLHWVEDINWFLFALFFCCYAYQIVYVGVRLFKKMPILAAKRMHRYAVLIAARNEGPVIGELLRSIRSQNYPGELVDIFVVADNCTDDTAAVARMFGATVFERFDTSRVGKGYALSYAFRQIKLLCGIDRYDGYMVFDADNVLDENYIREMNNVFDSGYRVVTSYRNSKNYGSNWISAGYALWFLRESKYLNGARMILKSSCAISGTGFLISSAIIGEDGGWKYSLLTEDIEFTMDKVCHSEVIGYSEKAILYDEQPVNFKTSWNQRMRWAKGFYQVMRHYGGSLLSGCTKGRRFQCFDMLMTIAPATLITLTMLGIDLAFCCYGLLTAHYAVTLDALSQIGICALNIYATLMFFGIVTLITEWKQIHCSAPKKIFHLFTFPLFMFTYLPIAVAAIYRKITWQPIRHTFVMSTSEIRR